MARGPKKIYRGRGGQLVVRVSDAEDADVKARAEAAGFKAYADYIRHLLALDAKRVALPPETDQFRPENKHAHKRLEVLLNRLDNTQREQLSRILDAAFPEPKPKLGHTLLKTAPK